MHHCLCSSPCSLCHHIQQANANSSFTGSISTADGSCLVRLGDTTMVCGVKAEIAEPSLEDPNRGFLSEWCFSILRSCVSCCVCFPHGVPFQVTKGGEPRRGLADLSSLWPDVHTDVLFGYIRGCMRGCTLTFLDLLSFAALPGTLFPIFSSTRFQLQILIIYHLSVPNVDLPALCSPKFKPGPPAEEAQVLSERLYDVLVG